MENPRFYAAAGIPNQRDYSAWWDQRSSREKLFTKIKPKMFGAKFVTSTTPEKTAKPTLASAAQERFNDNKFLSKAPAPLAPKPSIVSILSETGLIEVFPQTKGKKGEEDAETSVTSSMSSTVVTELTETIYKATRVIGKVKKGDAAQEEIGNTAVESEEKSEESDDALEVNEEPEVEREKRGKKRSTPSAQDQIMGKRIGLTPGMKRKQIEDSDDTSEYPQEVKNEKKLKSKWKAEMEMLMAKQSTNQTREDILAQKDASLKPKQNVKEKIEEEEEELSEATTETHDHQRMKQSGTNDEVNHKLHRSNKFHGLITEEDFDLSEPLTRSMSKAKPLKREDDEESESEEISHEVKQDKKQKEKRSLQPQFVVEELQDPNFVRVSKVQKEKPKVIVRAPSSEYNEIEVEEEVDELVESAPEMVDKRERKMKDYAKKVSNRAPTPYHHDDDHGEDDEDELSHQKQEQKKKNVKKRPEAHSSETELPQNTEELFSKKLPKSKKKTLAATAPSTEYHLPEEPAKPGRKRGEGIGRDATLQNSSANSPVSRKRTQELENELEQIINQDKRKQKVKQAVTTVVATDQTATSYGKDKKKKEILEDIYDDSEQHTSKQSEKKRNKRKELDKERKENVTDSNLRSVKKKKKAGPEDEDLGNAEAALASTHKRQAKQKGGALLDTKKEPADEVENEEVAIPEIIMKKMKELLTQEMAVTGKSSGKKRNVSEKTLQKYQDELIRMMGKGSAKRLTSDQTEVRKKKQLSLERAEDARTTVTETEESGRRSLASNSSVTSVASSSMKTPTSRVEHKRKHRTLEITLHVATLSTINEEDRSSKKTKKHRSREGKSEHEVINNEIIPMLPFVKMSESPQQTASQQSHQQQVYHSATVESRSSKAAMYEPLHSYDSHSFKKTDSSPKPVHAQVSVKSVLDHIPELIPADAELTTAEEEDIRYIVSQIISTQMSQGDLSADGPPITPEEAKLQAENVQSLISQILSPKNSRGDSHPTQSVSNDADAMQEPENLIKAIAEQSSMNNYNIDAVLRSVAAILAKQEELIELSKVTANKKVDRKVREKKKFEKSPVVEEEPDSEEESSKFSVSEVAIANDSELVDNSDAMDDLATIADDVSMGSSNEESFVPPGEETITEEPTIISESISAAKGSSGTEWSQSDTNSGEEASVLTGKVHHTLESDKTSETSLQPSSINLQSEASDTLRRPTAECDTIQEEEEEEESNSDSDDDSEQNIDRRPPKGPHPSKGNRADHNTKLRSPVAVQRGSPSRSAQSRGQQRVAAKFLPTKDEDDESSSESESID